MQSNSRISRNFILSLLTIVANQYTVLYVIEIGSICFQPTNQSIMPYLTRAQHNTAQSINTYFSNDHCLSPITVLLEQHHGTAVGAAWDHRSGTCDKQH
mmetsp:Transcript_18830/g.39602  ORF Transcript_18830/g.39602 Transcript_18830/m.39602 type:complete len:99 (+) Transcript_18830:194-490(+)